MDSTEVDLENAIQEIQAMRMADEIDRQILSELGVAMKISQGWIHVRVPWIQDDQLGNPVWWNEVCAWTVEQFGLPGEKFTYHPTEDYMDFVFQNAVDAEFFMLKWV